MRSGSKVGSSVTPKRQKGKRYLPIQPGGLAWGCAAPGRGANGAADEQWEREWMPPFRAWRGYFDILAAEAGQIPPSRSVEARGIPFPPFFRLPLAIPERGGTGHPRMRHPSQ